MNIQEVLELCYVNGNVIVLPTIQLDRKVYVELQKKLEAIGGKWDRKSKGFLFSTDPTELFNRLLDGENINPKKDFQFYETPSILATMMVELAEIKQDDMVLEPSAGKGVILKAIFNVPNDNKIYYAEIQKENRDYIENNFSNVSCVASDFLEDEINLRFDVIIANPPFSKNQDIKHVKRMYELLKDNGKIVTVMSPHFTFAEDKTSKDFREWLKTQTHQIIKLPENSFKSSGTNVNTVLLIIEK